MCAIFGVRYEYDSTQKASRVFNIYIFVAKWFFGLNCTEAPQLTMREDKHRRNESRV